MPYNVVRTDIKPQEDIIFFGKGYGNILRIDYVSHEIAKTLKEHSEGNTWFSKEIDMKEDKTKFDSLPDHVKRFFKLNIVYQTLMDSCVSKGIMDTIVSQVSTPIWEILYRRIAMEETIHAESYSYCLNEVFGHETSKIIDLIYSDEQVQKRMADEVALFNRLHEINNEPNADMDDCKKALLEVLIALYCLEGIKFPFSFLVTFTINDSYSNSIPGFTNNIKLIAHDELNTHVPTAVHLFRILRSEKHQGFTEYFKEENNWFLETLTNTVNKVVEQEIEWAEYLLKEGNINGMNIHAAEHFIKWRAKTIMNTLGYDSPYDSYGTNSITDFFENYRDINKHNAALQETSNTSYQKGTVVNDL